MQEHRRIKIANWDKNKDSREDLNSSLTMENEHRDLRH